MGNNVPLQAVEADIADVYGSAFEDALNAPDNADPVRTDPPVPVILAKANRELGMRDAMGLGVSRLLHVLLSLFASAHKASQRPPLQQPIDS